MDIQNLVTIYVTVTVAFGVFACSMAYTRPRAYMIISKFVLDFGYNGVLGFVCILGGALMMRGLIQAGTENFYAISEDPDSENFDPDNAFVIYRIIGAGDPLLKMLGWAIGYMLSIAGLAHAGKAVAQVVIADEEARGGPAGKEERGGPPGAEQDGHGPH